MSSRRKHSSKKGSITASAWSEWYDYDEGTDGHYQARCRIDKHGSEEWEKREPDNQDSIIVQGHQGIQDIPATEIPGTELNNNYGTAFGRMFHDMKIPVTKSSRNDCVIVSLAHLLNVSRKQVYSYWSEYPLKKLQGISLGEIEQLVWRLPGLKRLIQFPFSKVYSNANSRYLLHQQDDAIRLLRTWLGNGQGQKFALGYERVNGSGHCVVGRLRSGPEGYDLDDYCFKCYQKDGLDMSKEVKRSFLRFAICLDPENANNCLEMNLDETICHGAGDARNPVQVQISFGTDGTYSTTYDPHAV